MKAYSRLVLLGFGCLYLKITIRYIQKSAEICHENRRLARSMGRGKKRTGLFPVLVDDHDIGKVAVLGELNNVLHLELRLAFYEMGVGEDIHELCSKFVHRLV